MDPAGTALFAHPVMFPEEGAQVQVNKVPATFEVSRMFVFRLSHWVLDKGTLETSGVGYTVTT